MSQKIKISNERPFKGALKVLWNNVLGQTRKQGFVVVLSPFPCSENSSSGFKMFGKLSKFSVHKVPSTANLPVLQIAPENQRQVGSSTKGPVTSYISFFFLLLYMTQNKLKKKRKGLFGFTIQGAIVYHSKEGREDLWVGPLRWVFVKSGNREETGLCYETHCQ